MDDDGKDGNDASDGERTSVAHEDLCWIGVIPQESDECTDHGADEDDQFLRSWHEHDVEVGSILDVARHIGEYA